MDEKILLGKINETSYMLYQNREQEGIAAVAELLLQFQNMIKKQSESQMAEGGAFALMMLRELLEAYQSQDILGMADCLMEKSVLFVQFYFQRTE
jgi:replicative DNA helicase